MPVPGLDWHAVMVGLLSVFAFGGTALAVVGAPSRSGRAYRTRFAEIAAQKAAARGGTAGEAASRRRSIEDTLHEIEERQRAGARRKAPKPSLARRLKQAELTWSKRFYFMVCGIAGLAVTAAAMALGLKPTAAAGFGLAGGLLIPHLVVNFRRARRLKRFSNFFPSAVDVVVRGVKSGLPLTDCLRIIASEAEEPVRSEFKIVVEDQTIGISIQEAIQRLAERVPLSETNFFSIVIGIQSRTGGSLSESLGNLSKVLRERKKMRAKISAMSTEAKTSGMIIGALPLIVAGLVYLSNREYIMLLFEERIGNIVLAICGVWMMIGVMVMRKMISFDF
ncbi:type II secretion system F family protein [Jiella sp. M17.18]|uniref:type II secretion system F family protein n=1 Tax=Jiella sp. M17.18 TaxID=3234247 RepID=UPI0034E0043F